METVVSWLTDVSVFNLVLGLFVGACWFIALALAHDVYRNHRRGQKQLPNVFLGIAASLFLGIALGRTTYQNVRRAHYLRVGPCRYTVAAITHNFYSRSGRKFAVVYRVGTYQGQDQADCDQSGCRSAGTRLYIRFAAEAPEVCELTDLYVPDTLRVIPPLGWARIP